MRHVPNILTFFRLCLVPVFPIAFFSDHPQGQLIAMVIFIVAGITDFLDGYLARKYNIISKLGMVMDPLADKLMMLVALFTLWWNGTVPLALVLILIFKESFAISVGAYLYFRKGKFVIPSNYFGKVATGILFVAIPMRILFPDNMLGLFLIGVAITITLVALFSYSQYYRKKQASE